MPPPIDRPRPAPKITGVHLPRTFEIVRDQLRNEIRTGAYVAGDKFPNERELADGLGVSRHAVREALRFLESQGMIEMRKGGTGGAFVKRPDESLISGAIQAAVDFDVVSISHLNEARLHLEAIVVQLACERATEEEIAQLEENVRLAEAAMEAGNRQERVRLNIEFHNILARATKNPLMLTMTQALLATLNEITSRVGPVMGRELFEGRKKFIAHLKARRTRAAVRDMQAHLERLHRDLLALAPRR